MRKRMAMLLVLCMVSGIVYPAGSNETYAAEMQETEIISENVSSVNENLETVSAEADENGFVIEDGVLTSYMGAGGDVVIPDGVTSIGDSAFAYCGSLTSVEIPDGVTSIEHAAFRECENLTSVKIANSVTRIGASVFDGCSNLEDIELPTGITSIEYGVFSGCSKLADVEIPNSVMNIGQSAFTGCSNLTSIEIPDSVTSVGQSAFNGCSSLTSVDISTSITRIEAYLFAGCSNLTSIEIPENVTYIESHAFQNCNNLVSIELPQNIGNIEMGVFSGCSSLESIEIPAGALYIGNFAFQNCSNLTSIEIPESVSAIGESTFSGCKKLENVVLPSNISFTFHVGENAFYECSNLTDIKLPRGTTEIANAVFYGCSSLTDIEIPDGVTGIGANAFRNCIKLKKVSIPDSVTSIGGYAFDGCNEELCIYGNEGTYAQTYATENLINYMARKNQTITASDFTKAIGDEPFSLGAVTNGDGILTYESSDEEIVSVSDGGIVTIYKEGKATITITACGTAEWKEEQKSIDILVYSNSEDEFCIGSGYYMDYDSEELVKREGVLYAYRGDAEEVTIPDNVYIIEEAAFSGCDMVTSINIHKDVDIISAAAFDNCKNLKAINVEEVDEDYEDDVIYRSIDGVLYSFTACIRCPEGKEGSVEILRNTKQISNGAFSGCSKLPGVTILGKNTRIYDNAFVGCSENFYIDCLKGSYAETYAIEKGIKYVSRKPTQQLYVYETDISVTIGEEPYILDVDLEEGDGALTYASSDETVVTVSETGVLAFVGVGTAEITITASETDEWSETKEVINITVNDTQNEGQKPNEGQTPGGEQEPNEGQTPDEEQNPNEEPDTTQELETEKEEQTITAKNMKKTYSTKSFSLGAKTDGGGELTYSVENKKIAKVDKNGKVTIKGCGVTKVVIKAAENEDYNAATKTITLTVVPKKATLTSVKSTKTKTITVKWKKDTKASGYIIEYSTDKKFKKNVGKVTVSKNKTTSKKISKLKAGKKYYVRVCAYTVSKGNKIKGAYTKAKMVKVKK